MSLTLLDWRRRVAALYREVRSADAERDGQEALRRFRRGRDELFASHPDSPLDGPARASFSGLAYAPYRPDLRFEADVDLAVERIRLFIEGSDGQVVPFTRFGRVHLPVGELDLFWLDTYGGGVFLAFRDATSGTASYGGGRYLLDTVKGADLGGDGGRLVIDFNYAYHPSCFYDSRWGCPLAPPENRLQVAIEAGEQVAR
ncbi:MAG: DUF1684 domain-containing protein [Actinobacteria bacterium]|nr:DUF1684 domain-containing protein [Actinomycetota bacterium]